MTIDLKRVFGGGLIAGLLIIISAVIMTLIVGKEMEVALAKFDLPPMGYGAAVYFGFVSLSMGFSLVLIYAVVSPRLGPGIGTALIVSIGVWFLASFLANVSMVVYGFMPLKLTAIGTIWSLFELGVGGVVGTRFYKDKEPKILKN